MRIDTCRGKTMQNHPPESARCINQKHQWQLLAETKIHPLKSNEVRESGIMISQHSDLPNVSTLRMAGPAGERPRHHEAALRVLKQRKLQ